MLARRRCGAFCVFGAGFATGRGGSGLYDSIGMTRELTYRSLVF